MRKPPERSGASVRPATLLALHARPAAAAPVLHERLAAFVKARQAGFDLVPEERRTQLDRLARFVGVRVKAGTGAKLTFICTHDSRRGHLGRIWAQTAAHVSRVPGVSTFSGGTEATAFDPRAVAAIARAGFTIEIGPKGTNRAFP